MNPAIDQAKAAIARAAQDMLDGRLSYIEGARLILRLAAEAELSTHDDDILPFVGIDSETDAFPFGPVRERWNREALAKLQPKIDRAEQWARELGRPYCQVLVARFAGPA
ncbi:hypothetical protein [Inquilinus sp. CA228]|uniref:hypothetical protein n=1 Tax=Inquilinus sp. CA228 TaxID=3455609 RepID=UPI003F8D77EE